MAVREIDSIPLECNIGVLQDLRETFLSHKKRINEKINQGIADVVLKFDNNLYTRVLKTLKLNVEKKKLEGMAHVE